MAQIVFEPPSSVFDGAPAFAIQESASFGDFDEDGLIDLAVLRGPFVHELTVFRGDGAGGLQPLPTVVVSLTAWLDGAADVDGDGHLDLLVSGPALTNASFVVMRGHGDGTFDAPLGTTVPFIPEFVAAARLDGDGMDDVVCLGGIAVSVLHATGAGTFVTAQSLSVTTLFAPIAGMSLADVDDDGLLDLVVGRSDGDAAIYAGNAGGTFATTPTLVAITPAPAFNSVRGFGVADVDADGRPDLVASDVPSNTVSVRLGLGGGAFAPIVGQPIGGAGRLVTADFDGDGRADVLVSLGSSDEAVVLRSEGGGVLSESVRVTTGADLFFMTTGDLQGDGRAEVAAHDASLGGGGLVLLRNATYLGDEPFADLGGALKGGEGWPVLLCDGALVRGQPFAFTLAGAAPDSQPTLVVGDALLGQPFLGGVLWPAAERLLPMPRVGADGRSILSGIWPTGTSGTEVVLQAWFPDAGGAQGWASTTGVLGLAP